VSNLGEYLAGTRTPNNANSSLAHTAYDYHAAIPVTWSSVLSRSYYVQPIHQPELHEWATALGLISPDVSSTTRMVAGTNSPAKFYRVSKAVLPLSP